MRRNNLMTTWLRLSGGLACWVATTAWGQTAPPAPTGASSESAIEEIVVTGIRRSLADQAELKKNADTVVDGISAEDLGKFPDSNVAESLQRITGVAIARTRGGEGQFATVRGLGEQFNAVTYNGRLLATENPGREFSFDVIGSEMIAGAEVYKTASAEQGDGSLGGRIDLRSVKPLDKPGFHVAGGVGDNYDQLGKFNGLKASGLISDTFADNTMGFLLSAAYNKKKSRVDYAESGAVLDNIAVDSKGNASPAPYTTPNPILTNNAFYNGFSEYLLHQDNTRENLAATFQYRPSDAFTLTVDALGSRFSAPSTLQGLAWYPSVGLNNDTTGAQLNGANQIVAFSTPAYSTDMLYRYNQSYAHDYSLGTNADWHITDRTTSITDVSYSQATGNRDNASTNAGSGSFYVIGNGPTVGANNGTLITSSLSGNPVPNFTSLTQTLPGGPFVTTNQLSPVDSRLHFARNSTIYVNDTVFSINQKFKTTFDDKTSVAYGVDYSVRQKSDTQLDNIPTQCAFCGYATPFSTYGNTANLFEGFSPNNFLSSVSSNIPRVFPLLNGNAIAAAYANYAAQKGIASPLSPILDQAASFIVNEKVFGAFAQLNFEGTVLGLPYRGNAGVRLANTRGESTGFGNQIGDLQSVAVSGNNESFTVAAPKPINIHNNYFDLLPSYNVALTLNSQTQLRTGFSRTVSRPTITDLATNFNLTGTNVGNETITAGNPNLAPIRSNNFDLSLEWYGEHSVSASAALFYKDISGFITNVVTHNQSVTVQDVTTPGVNATRTITPFIQQPENGQSARIYGLELAGQYLWVSGFGVSANATGVRSHAIDFNGNSTPMEKVSNFSANASVFFERDWISARLSLAHRSSYFADIRLEGGNPDYVAASNYLDAAISYSPTQNVSVYLDATNLTNETQFKYSITRDFLTSYEQDGRLFTIGVRAKF